MTATAGSTFHHLGVTEVAANRRLILLSDDSEFSYDYLVVSPGTEFLWPVAGATSYRGPPVTRP